MTLPTCPLRTEIKTFAGVVLHCGHDRIMGYPLDIVPPRRCETCRQINVPCDVPRPAPAAILRFGRRAIAVELFAWGRMLRRLIRLATFGRVRSTGCGPCGQRAEKLDRLGARVARWWRG